MGDNTGIEWTDATWNPVTGCTKVSQGCKFCYAESVARRWWGGRDFSDVRTHPERLSQPTRWKRPRRIFVNSMSDLFHESVPSEFVEQVWQVMANNPRHTFQILTKRPERMMNFTWGWWGKYREVLPNVWLGTSIEDGEACRRLPILQEVKAAVRFISFEPLLGPIRGLHLKGIDWVIVGGESGPNARPMEADWARGIAMMALDVRAAFFMKQMGGTRDKRGKIEDLPEDLRVREFPRMREHAAGLPPGDGGGA